MGPEATAELYLRIIRIFQKNGAKYDSDFPEMVILNLPLPDVVESSENKSRAKKMLIRGAKKIESAGASFIAIPCNTASCFIKDMRNAVSLPLLSIPELVEKLVRNNRKVGLLGTESTINDGVYDLIKDKLIFPSKQQQKQLTKIIMNILSGNKTSKDKITIIKIIQDLELRKAEKIILGCTELPLLIKRKDCIDTIDILADEIVAKVLNTQNKGD